MSLFFNTYINNSIHQIGHLEFVNLTYKNSVKMSEGNLLFPVFLKLDKLHVLIVGGGNVGLEKIGLMFKHASNAKVRLVAPSILPEIEDLIREFPDQIEVVRRNYQVCDLYGIHVLIAATEVRETNLFIRAQAKEKNILVNVADTPDLCDFYLSSVVKKGDLKIAISTNGKSPTIGKRVKEMLQDVLPNEIDDLLDNLKVVRDSLKGDFDSKVKTLNEITKDFKSSKK